MYSPSFFSGALPLVTFDFLTPKSNQHIHESKYICDQNWMKLTSLVCEILIFVNIFDLWSFDLINVSQALVHTWFQFGEICSNIYEDVIFTRFSGHCMLWPRPLTFWPQNLISTFSKSSTSVTKIGWNSLYWFLRYDVHKVFIRTDARTHGRTYPNTECLRHRFNRDGDIKIPFSCRYRSWYKTLQSQQATYSTRKILN